MRGKDKIHKYIIILVIISCGYFLQRKYLNEFPSHIHAWAQSDRYALALGFVKNHFDFFHPRTFVLNHQFPGGFKVPSENTITSVDFPIHDYIPAIIMKVFGTTSPWCFRLYIFLYSMTGLFFLYKISNILFKNIYKSVLVVIFAATSPVFAYYQAGFLPTIPSLANGFAGIYFYLRYLEKKKINTFYYCILFLTLSGLSRTPFSILLFVIIFSECLNFLITKRADLKKIRSIVISLTFIAGYFIYNYYLREKYGSMFLNHIMPASNYNELTDILKEINRVWLYQYFSKIHYIIFIGILLIAIIVYAKNKITLNYFQKKILLIVIVTIFCCLIYSLLMFRQFAEHDYYFLDTFYTPLILLFTLALSLFPVSKYKYLNLTVNIIALPVIIILVFGASKELQYRRKTLVNDVSQQTINNYSHAKEFLDSLKIPENAKILDLCSFAPNISFILMDRVGYASLNTSLENMQLMLTWKYDFIVIQNEFFIRELYSIYPEIVNKIKKIGDNGHISIYKLYNSDKKHTLMDFLGLTAKTPLLKKEMTFDSVPDKEWQNIKSTSLVAFSGKFSGLVTNNDEYGITFNTNKLKGVTKGNHLLNFKAFFFNNNDLLKECFIVASVSSQNENLLYKATDLAPLMNSRNSWEEVELNFQLPEIVSDNLIISVYLWNKGHNLLYFDDIKIQIL